jgi:hypothetical protein
MPCYLATRRVRCGLDPARGHLLPYWASVAPSGAPAPHATPCRAARIVNYVGACFGPHTGSRGPKGCCWLRRGRGAPRPPSSYISSVATYPAPRPFKVVGCTCTEFETRPLCLRMASGRFHAPVVLPYADWFGHGNEETNLVLLENSNNRGQAVSTAASYWEPLGFRHCPEAVAHSRPRPLPCIPF